MSLQKLLDCGRHLGIVAVRSVSWSSFIHALTLAIVSSVVTTCSLAKRQTLNLGSQLIVAIRVKEQQLSQISHCSDMDTGAPRHAAGPR